MRPTNHLVVFAKTPRLGAVKTRLARDIGAVAATRFARLAADALLRRLATDPRWRLTLAVTPDRDAGNSALWPARVPRMPQGSGDLGTRMARPLHRLSPGPVVIVGTDIPAVRPRHIAQAFRLLGDHNAVFGPAADGGYWLVGVRRRPRVPDLYRNVRWSTPHALGDTVANLAGRRVAYLDTLEDVDDGGAYARSRVTCGVR